MKYLLVLIILLSSTVGAFDLILDKDEYADTSVVVLAPLSQSFSKSGFFTCTTNWDFNDSTYEIGSLGTIKGWGGIKLIKFVVPVNPMDYGFSYAIVTNEDNAYKTAYGKKSEGVILDSPNSYEEMLENISSTPPIVDYYVNCKFSEIGVADNYEKERFEYLQFAIDDRSGMTTWKTSRLSEYVAYITNAENQSLRICVDSIYRTDDDDNIYSLDSIKITISTDSAGNGKFKLKDAPVLSKGSLSARNSSLSITNSLLTLPKDIRNGYVMLFTLMGKKVFSSEVKMNTISLPNLPTGVYTAVVESSSGTLEEKILIK